MPASAAEFSSVTRALVMASFVGGVAAQASPPPVAPPAWWGGFVETPEAGLQEVVAWCKRAIGERGHGGEQVAASAQCMFVSRDRKLAVLGQVATPARPNRDPRMTKRLAAAQKQTDRLRLKKFCLRAAWIAQGVDPMQRVLAFEGFEALRDGGGAFSGGARSGSVAVRGLLPAGVAFQDYKHDGVTYSVALFRDLDRASDVEVSFGGDRMATCAALGALRSGPKSGERLEAVLAWAMSRSKDPEVVRAAVQRVGEGDGDAAAAKRLWQELQGVMLQIPANPRGRDAVQAMLCLAGVEDSCAGLDARGVAAWLRGRGLDTLGFVVLDAQGPALLYALRQDGDLRVLRDRLLDQVGRGGRPQPTDVALDWHGEPIECPRGLLDGLPAFASPFYDVAQADWLLVRSAAAAAALFASTRVRVAAVASETPADVVRRAVVQYVVDKRLWALVSACDLAAVLDAEDLRRFVAFQVPTGSGAWEVDLLPDLQAWLEQRASSVEGSYRLVAPDEVPEDLDIVNRLALERWRAEDASPGLELRVSWEVGEQEKGKDEDAAPGRATDWVRLPVKLRCEVAVVGTPPAAGTSSPEVLTSQSLERDLYTVKTYGGHDPRRRLGKTVGDGLGALSAELPALLTRLSLHPSPVTVTLASDVSDDVRRRIQTFGEGQLRAAAGQAGAADASSDSMQRMQIVWPGGPGGLRRALELCAASQAFEGVSIANQ